MTADRQAACERRRNHLQFRVSYAQYDLDAPVTQGYQSWEKADLVTLADAYLEDHTPEREAERCKVVEIFTEFANGEAPGFLLTREAARRLIALLTEPTT